MELIFLTSHCVMRPFKKIRKVAVFSLVLFVFVAFWKYESLSSSNAEHMDSSITRFLQPAEDEAGSNSNELMTINEYVMEIVNLNPESAVAADILSIIHIQNEGKIIVRLKRPRRCQQPQLIGRLSGQALTKIKWEEGIYVVENEDILIGYYNVPVPGQYFIEIIITMCIELTLDTDVKPICLEDPMRHRITQNGALVNIKSFKGHTGAIGFWYNTLVEPVPLYTRYQPQGCKKRGGEGQDTSPLCKEATDLSRFEPYEFQFASEFSLERSLKYKKGKVCFEGASHSKYLFERSHSLINSLNIEDIDILRPPLSIRTSYAADFTRDVFQEIIDRNCTKVVIGTGQWDAGYPRNKPTLFPEYEKSLEEAMSIIIEMTRNNTDIDFFFRTTQ